MLREHPSIMRELKTNSYRSCNDLDNRILNALLLSDQLLSSKLTASFEDTQNMMELSETLLWAASSRLSKSETKSFYDKISLLILLITTTLRLLIIFPFRYHFIQRFLPRFSLVPLADNIKHMVHSEHSRRLQLHILSNRQFRGPQSLLPRLIHSQVPIPVPVDDAADNVHVFGIQHLNLIVRVRC
jgi:hypothetical protein